MRWIVDRAPVPFVVIAKICMVVAIFWVGVAAALWLYFEGGILLLIGAFAGVVVLGELAWDRPRRKRLRAELASTQLAPGTQALRTEAGPRHWTDRLPQPLRSVAQTAPFALVAIGGFMLTLVLISVFGSLGTDVPDTHVRLEEGAHGEVELKFGGEYRIRVTILRIADAAEPRPEALRALNNLSKYWAAEVEVENLGSREISSPTWVMGDSQGDEREATGGETLRAALPTAFALAPGERRSGWLIFFMGDRETEWLRVTPPTPSGYLQPDHLYFDAE